MIRRHIMLDLETMGDGPRAAVVAIGAVPMDDNGVAAPEWQHFYKTVSLQSSMDAGLETSAGTIMWWLEQDAVARSALTVDTSPLNEVLFQFATWLPEYSLIWGYGPASDNVWMKSAYTAVGQRVPWTHKQDRCFRTVVKLHSDVPPPPDNAEAHHALADAQWQAEYARRICEAKNLKLN